MLKTFSTFFSFFSTECAYLSNTFLEEQIDGQAFMLLNLPTVQQHLRLKIGPAIRLCHIIERVKLGFFLGYCEREDDDDDDDEEEEREGSPESPSVGDPAVPVVPVAPVVPAEGAGNVIA